MFLNSETLPTHFRVNSNRRKRYPLTSRHISSLYLPLNDMQVLDCHCSWKSLNILSFSGHPPKTGSVANFLSFDFFVRDSVNDILWIIIPKKKEKDLAILDNAIALLLTLQFIDIYLRMTTGFLLDYLSERLPCWEEHTKQDSFFKYVPTSVNYILINSL